MTKKNMNAGAPMSASNQNDKKGIKTFTDARGVIRCKNEKGQFASCDAGASTSKKNKKSDN